MTPLSCKAEPPRDCELCPRLTEFRQANRDAHPDWFNGPVPSFGEADAKLLIVGLAPGLQGANRTGRPFTGDYAGDLLYSTLIDMELATGSYEARPDDGLRLKDSMITNAVRCVPPQNKPTAAEINECRRFLAERINALPHLKVILALGRIAHDSVISAVGEKRSAYPFAHGARHQLPTGQELFDSYHCSRYNTNTGRLTETMFRNVLLDVKKSIHR